MKLVTFVFFSVLLGFGASGFLSPVSKDQPVKKTFPPVSVSFKNVRAVYLTAASASLPARIDKIIKLIKSTRLNAVVINVKDGDGEYLGKGMEEVAEKFRAEGIYPIARVVVFQDNTLVKTRADLALRDASGNLWASGNGKYLWVDPASREVWDRTADTAVKALDAGFKEVNFDYIRFPSDGDTRAIVYPIFDDKTQLKVSIMKECFKYLTEKIRKARPEAILSIDLFADSFLRNDGLGIGQKLADAAENFDVVSPMAYPSHYQSGNFGFENPADEPYQVVFQTLESGKKFLTASSTVIIRPWIQDFDLGAIYDKEKVNEEIRAVRDAGFGDAWMDWNPSNIYDAEKFAN
jgi:hypothetical protein